MTTTFPGDKSITPAVIKEHKLTPDEYAVIEKSLGRAPTYTELGVFSVMWSEHCSYKSSRVHLRRLPTKGPRVIQGPGENAGVVDIGDGLAVVFKMESHNHPSFIEPYQGAATGVGGIIRDIFTMGARPIALMDSLRFGPMEGPGSARTVRIVQGVVAGIAGYGNSIGIPTIGGEVAFEECYAGNPLVNVLCLGIARADALVKGRADGVDNPVYYVQYAHARICSLWRVASERGIARPTADTTDLTVLTDPDELGLIKKLSSYPEVIRASALAFEPHRVTYYLQQLAAQLHTFYNKHRVLPPATDQERDETAPTETFTPQRTAARLVLMGAVQQVLRNGLDVLGISAPEHM